MVKHTEMLLLRLLGAIGFQWALEVEVQRGKGFFFSVFEFDILYTCMLLPRCFTYSLGLQDIQWTLKLIMMRVNWSEHSGLYKKNLPMGPLN